MLMATQSSCLGFKVLLRICTSFPVIDCARQITIYEMISCRMIVVFGANDSLRATAAGLLSGGVYALLGEVLGLRSPVFGRQAFFCNFVLLH